MTYEEITSLIESKRRFGKESGCEVMREMLPRFGSPERDMKIIHIAGTNGKGSTAAFVSAILQAAGFCVGLFTSPHLMRFTERICLNGKEIRREDVVRLGELLLRTEWKVEGTMFDYCLLMALLYYRERKPDYVILETGLGGRLDSTNGLSKVPLVSVITKIGLEHTAILGNSPEEIAAEKAGMLKTGTRAVIAEMDEAPRRVLKEACISRGIPYVLSDSREIRDPLSLFGVHQRENAANAVCAIRQLFLQDEGKWPKLSGEETLQKGKEGKGQLSEWIRRGLTEAFIPGRLEKLWEDKKGSGAALFIDGAHNPQGAEALNRSMQMAFPGESFLMLCGILADKDYVAMIRNTAPVAYRYFTVTPPGNRALSAEALSEVIRRETGKEALPFGSLEEGLKTLLETAKATGKKAVVFGSLYMIGEVRAHFPDARQE